QFLGRQPQERIEIIQMDDPQALPCPEPGYDVAVSGSAWGIVWLAVALKVPIIALLYLVWWAIKDPPEQVIDEDGGWHDRDPFHPPAPPPASPAPGPAPPAGARRARPCPRGRAPHAAPDPSVAFAAWKASTSR